MKTFLRKIYKFFFSKEEDEPQKEDEIYFGDIVWLYNYLVIKCKYLLI